MKFTESFREIAINLLTDAAKKILEHLWTLLIAGGVLTLIFAIRNFLLTPQEVRPIVILIGVVCLLVVIFIVTRMTMKKVVNIPISNKFYHGHGPNLYTEKTRWNYKQYKDYYYIPLLSHGYEMVKFVDFCGPFCEKCHHLLTLESGLFGHKFSCLNCARRFSIPKELITGDYKKRLFQYFETEYKLRHLKEITL